MLAVNNWADEANANAFEGIESDGGGGDKGKTQERFTVRRPVASDPDVIKMERAVIVSSVFLKIVWKNSYVVT